MDRLDIHKISKPFRNPAWKPPQRRNKNVKQIIADAQRKEASVLATQNNSGASTPVPGAAQGGQGQTLLAQATHNLSNLQVQGQQQANKAVSNGAAPATAQTASSGPAVTYTNIESAPSLHPSSQRHYCDITGLPAPYTDPKSRLRYHNMEVFAVVRGLGQGVTEGYLAARGAHTVLK